MRHFYWWCLAVSPEFGQHLRYFDWLGQFCVVWKSMRLPKRKMHKIPSNDYMNRSIDALDFLTNRYSCHDSPSTDEKLYNQLLGISSMRCRILTVETISAKAGLCTRFSTQCAMEATLFLISLCFKRASPGTCASSTEFSETSVNNEWMMICYWVKRLTSSKLSIMVLMC